MFATEMQNKINNKPQSTVKCRSFIIIGINSTSIIMMSDNIERSVKIQYFAVGRNVCSLNLCYSERCKENKRMSKNKNKIKFMRIKNINITFCVSKGIYIEGKNKEHRRRWSKRETKTRSKLRGPRMEICSRYIR